MKITIESTTKIVSLNAVPADSMTWVQRRIGLGGLFRDTLIVLAYGFEIVRQIVRQIAQPTDNFSVLAGNLVDLGNVVIAHLE